MKFPRNAKLLRSPFDVAPFAAVFFLLIFFVLLGVLLPAPGISLSLPATDTSLLPGTDKPTVAVAIDSGSRLYYASQMVTEKQLSAQLKHAAAASREPLTLVIQADQLVPYGQIVHVALLARDAGIYNALLAMQPRIVPTPGQP
ncbi:MAG TPA: biopolymer transporter ExbD [Candidatus Acidoferrum sp.]|nr:biopolymer transporter ExbD [Candidatus Acidoferrum sp.]